MRPCASAPRSANELDARGDVAPLVAAAELQRDSRRTAELEKVVGLEQHVGELGEGDAALHAGRTDSFGSM